MVELQKPQASLYPSWCAHSRWQAAQIVQERSIHPVQEMTPLNLSPLSASLLEQQHWGMQICTTVVQYQHAMPRAFTGRGGAKQVRHHAHRAATGQALEGGARCSGVRAAGRAPPGRAIRPAAREAPGRSHQIAGQCKPQSTHALLVASRPGLCARCEGGSNLR